MEQNKIFIRQSSGIGYQINYQSQRPIKYYLYRLGNSSLTRSSQFQVLYHNQIIDIEKSFDQNQIVANSILHISFPYKFYMQKTQQITFIYVFYNNDIYTVSTEPCFSVKNIKDFLFDQINVPVQQQLLVYQGRKLQDTQDAFPLYNSLITLIATQGQKYNQKMYKTHDFSDQKKKISERCFSFSVGCDAPMIKVKEIDTPKLANRVYFQQQSSSQSSYSSLEESMQFFVENHPQSKLKSTVSSKLSLQVQNVPQIVLTSSNSFDTSELIKPKPKQKQSYKIQLIYRRNGKKFDLFFSQQHSIEDIKKLIRDLAFKGSQYKVKMVSLNTKKQIMVKKDILIEIESSKQVPIFEIQFMT